MSVLLTVTSLCIYQYLGWLSYSIYWINVVTTVVSKYELGYLPFYYLILCYISLHFLTLSVIIMFLLSYYYYCEQYSLYFVTLCVIIMFLLSYYYYLCNNIIYYYYLWMEQIKNSFSPPTANTVQSKILSELVSVGTFYAHINDPEVWLQLFKLYKVKPQVM